MPESIEYCKGVNRIGEGCNLYKTCSYPKCREDASDINFTGRLNDNEMKNIKKFLEDKDLKLKNPMEGYVIPYSQLVSLIAEFTKRETSKYKELFEAAKLYIDESPCDPDIYTKQLEAWTAYQKLLDDEQKD